MTGFLPRAAPPPTHCRSLILMRNRTRKLLLFLSRGHSWEFRFWRVDRVGQGYSRPWIQPVQCASPSTHSLSLPLLGGCREKRGPQHHAHSTSSLPRFFTHRVGADTARPNSVQAEPHLVEERKGEGRAPKLSSAAEEMEPSSVLLCSETGTSQGVRHSPYCPGWS